MMMRIEFPPAVMTREVAAYYIGESLAGLDLLKRQKKITPMDSTKRVKYLKSDLDRYIASIPERTPTGGAS